VYVFTHIFHIAGTQVRQKKYNKTWDSSEHRVPRKTFDVPFWTRVPKVRQPWVIHRIEGAIPASLTIKVPLQTAGFIISGSEPSRSAARRPNTGLLKDVQIRINFITFTDVAVENRHH